VKMIRNSNAFSLQPMERFVLAALLCVIVLSAGCVISPRRIVGGPGSPTPTPTVNGSASGKIYVSIPSSNTILRFDNASTANGTTSPVAVISGTQTTLNSPQGIFVDEAADRLYVANQAGASILVFDAISTKTGSIVPTRTIFGPSTSLLSPSGVAVDTVKNILYVSDGVDLLAFNNASTASGDAAFARDIKFGFTIAGMYLDSGNDRLFLADASTNAIDIFDNVSALNVTTAPSRQLIGAATQLNQPSGVAVDATGRVQQHQRLCECCGH
jgi:DNA-binding beta-propeller fold protein YncE